MRRIDDPSAVSTLPIPEAAGAEGYFTEGVPGVTPATLVRASFLNMVQEELRAVVTAAGLTPSKTTYDQVLSAIEILARNNAGNYGVDTGSVNSYRVTYSPAVSVVNDGAIFKFRAKTANTGASNFSPAPSSIVAAPILGNDHLALSGGEIVVNGHVDVQWNSALNSGNGAWVLLESTGGYSKSPTPVQFDNSQKLATTGFVQRALGNVAGVSTYGTNATLTASDVGKWIFPTASSLTLTLPLASTVPIGAVIQISGNATTSGVTVLRQGADVLFMPISSVTNFLLGSNDVVTLVNVTGTGWYVLGGEAHARQSSSFGSLLASNGYQRLPSGLILQWGSGLTNAGSVQVNFPIAFPTACYSVQAMHSGGGGAIIINVNSGGPTPTSFIAGSDAASFGTLSGSYGFFWFAIGA